MAQSIIPCWTNYDIPPWSVFFAFDILNPHVIYAPVFIIEKTAWDLLPVTAFPAADSASWTEYNMRADALTNGPTPIPAHSQFAATSLLDGIHWMAYDEDSDPESITFHPSGEWTVSDADIPAANWPEFRRVGPANETLKCVPVIMQPHFAYHEIV